MSFLSNPRTLYFTRIAQLLFGIGVLVTISYAGVHRGWYSKIDGSLAVGVIAAIFTFAVTLHTIITHHMNTNPFSGGSKTRTLLRFAAEGFVLGLWVATAALLLRPRAGCGVRRVVDGHDLCWPNKTSKSEDAHVYSEHPEISWNLGIAFALVEIVSFIISLVLVYKEDREKKVTGQVSYA